MNESSPQGGAAAPALHVDGARLWQRLMTLAAIGATPRGGVCRIALTDLDRQGRELFATWAAELGCTLRRDSIGNLFARRAGTDDSLPAVATGSHIDTQPTGGKFDGNYGVLAGLEVLHTLNDHGVRTHAPLEVCVWTNEEGSRFVPVMMGSGVFAGAFTLEKAYAAVANANRYGIDVNINCVINKLNADHLDEGIKHWITHHPYIQHFVWNNLDPSMGRAEVNQDQFTPRLADFEVSLHRALRLLHQSGRTFRVEKVPLCYMSEFAWASTETRKIVKGEERIVHFLDAKQTVRQTDWEHIYAEGCASCSLRTICGGLFDRGNAYDPGELYPVFVDRDAVVEKILRDPKDPSYQYRTLEAWRKDFEVRIAESALAAERKARQQGDRQLEDMSVSGGPAVGQITEQGLRLFQAKRLTEGKKAQAQGLALEKTDLTMPPEGRGER
jgi:hypothetical protein